MAALELSKPMPTGLMRTLIGSFYTTERLATSSATKGISTQIKTAIFDCRLAQREVPGGELQLNGDLTQKRCEARREMRK